MSGEAKITVTVDDSGLSKLLNRFAAYKSKTVPEIVRAQGRLVAVNLAHNTQPYGNDDAARFKGTNAVRIDIGRVFIGPYRIFEIAKSGTNNRVSQWLANAMADGDVEGVRTAWQTLTNRPIIVSKNVVPSWHQSQRNKRGRVRKGAAPMIVIIQRSIDTYTRSKEKLVGFGKSGWAAAARALGGTRGIPGWVSRNKGPGGVTDMTRGNTPTPYVVLHNQVRYVDLILPESERRAAVQIQAEKMVRAIEHGIEAEKKAVGF